LSVLAVGLRPGAGRSTLPRMSDDALFGLLGVLVGALISGGFTAWFDRQRRKRQLLVAVARCRDRLEKIEALRKATASTDAEFQFLGSDLESYLAAMAAAPRARFLEHFALYERVRQVLLDHTIEPLGPMIEDLAKFLPKAPST
jgi:hypothetical protein